MSVVVLVDELSVNFCAAQYIVAVVKLLICVLVPARRFRVRFGATHF